MDSYKSWRKQLNGPLDHKVTKQEQLCLQKHKGPYFNVLSQIQILFLRLSNTGEHILDKAQTFRI